MIGTLSIGKIRGLQQISNKNGHFIICAMDHRESMMDMIGQGHPEKVKYQDMVEYKQELCQALAPVSSAVLLDPIYGAAPCISANSLSGEKGLLVSIEATGYQGKKTNRITKLQENWSVEKIKLMGASAVKLLLYYRPDLVKESQAQLDTVKKVADDCLKYDIPFLVEPKAYPIENEREDSLEYALKKPALVTKTAADITSLPVDVLKAEFPGDLRYHKDEGLLADYCQSLNESTKIPWAILSAGVDFEHFEKEVEIACRAGASGFLAGRAIWQEAMHLKNRADRIKYLNTVAIERMKRLNEITAKYATAWYKKMGLKQNTLTEVTENWYATYERR